MSSVVYDIKTSFAWAEAGVSQRHFDLGGGSVGTAVSPSKPAAIPETPCCLQREQHEGDAERKGAQSYTSMCMLNMLEGGKSRQE